MERNEISKKHLNFVDQYFLYGFNATKAYQKAYPKATEKSSAEAASRLLQTPLVIAEIEKRQQKLAEKNEIKRDYIIEDLNDLILECKNKGDRRNLLGAITLLCKMSGQFTPQELDVTTSYNVSFGGATKEEDEDGEE